MQEQLETKMEEYLVKKSPVQIPENGRKALVQWMPWIALVFGVLSLLSALGLWNLAHRANDLINLSDQISRAYGGPGVSTNYGFVFYAAFVVLLVSGLLMVLSFMPLKNRQKRGWDLALLGVVVNFVYGIVYLFSGVGSVAGRFVSTILSTLIGLYLLAQIRSYYLGKATKTVEPKKEEPKKS
jgi:hypothetical protein